MLLPRRLRVLVLLGFLTAAASARAGFKCPAKGGSEWRAYRSTHFAVYTDAAELKVTRLIAQLESMHVLEVQALVGEQVEIPGRLRVIAFADPALFTELAGRYQIAGYYKASFFSERTIVLPVEGIDADPQTVAHEVAHHVSSFLFVRQPPWFSEGLAAFLQTVAAVERPIEPGTGSHIVRGQRDHGGAVGAVPMRIAAGLQEAPRVSFNELWDWNGGDDRSGSSYHLYGWLLYHWLWNTRSKDLSTFQQRLSNGDDPREAWRLSFPDLDPANASAAAKVDDALEGYRHSGRYMSYKVEAKADVSFQKGGTLPSADVHMLMDDASNSWTDEERTANVEEALSEDPSEPGAIVRRAHLDKASPLEALRKSVAARRGDWRSWLSLGETLPPDAKEEKEEAFRKAVALNPDNSEAHNNLAWLLVTQGRAKEALPIANRALDLSPGAPAIIDTLASVAAAVGKCADAVVLERRAAELAPPKSNMAQALRKKAVDYQSRCGAAVPAAATNVPVR
jgi:tetratricopeptide (TPR) repeat protein